MQPPAPRGEDVAAILGELTFTVADAADRGKALDLRARIYSEDLGHHGVDRFDELATHLIAKDSSGDILAAFRCLLPHQRPFEIEQYVRIDDIVSTDRRPAQIGGFWIRKDHRLVRRNAFIQVGMLKLAHAFARKHACTDFLMYTYEHLRRFYHGAFFRTVTSFEHTTWGTVHLMHLDLLALESRKDRTRSMLHRLLFEESPRNVVV